jgi:integrase
MPYDGPGRHSRSHKVASTASTGTDIVAGTNLASIRAFQAAASSINTRIGYQTDWKGFSEWCATQKVTPLPADPMTVAGYLAYSANLVDERGEWFYAPNTLARWLAAINKAHELAGFTRPGLDPEVNSTMSGIRRERARPEARKAPLLLNDLRRTLTEIDLKSWPHGVIGHRDYALLLLGFAGAYRRSELASLEVGDVRIHSEDGLHILLRQSKTDQEGRGSIKGLPYGANPVTCAPCAFVRWVRVVNASRAGRPAAMRVLHTASIDRHVCRGPQPELDELVDHDRRAPLFRPVMKNGSVKDRPISGAVINHVVQRRVATAGLNPVIFGAHSLRAGFVTQAFRAGATHHEVMRQTGHKSVTTLEIYSRENDPLAHNAVTRINL